MSQELERVYTINLGKVKLSQSQHRSVRAINMIREFARHHMKVETIKIEEDLAREVWARGVRSPPRKVRVRMSKTEEGYVLVSRYDEDVDTKVTPEKETKKVSDTVETPAKEDTCQGRASRDTSQGRASSRDTCQGRASSRDTCQGRASSRDTCQGRASSRDTCQGRASSRDTCQGRASSRDTCQGRASKKI